MLLGALLVLTLMSFRSFGRNPLAGVFGEPLDGSAWVVKVRRQSLIAFGSKDTLIFDKGQFSSMEKLTDGFLPAGYSAPGRLSTDAVWESALKGEDGSVLNWQGRIEDDRMEGTVVWTRSDGTTRRYRFHGRRKD